MIFVKKSDANPLPQMNFVSLKKSNNDENSTNNNNIPQKLKAIKDHELMRQYFKNQFLKKQIEKNCNLLKKQMNEIMDQKITQGIVNKDKAQELKDKYEEQKQQALKVYANDYSVMVKIAEHLESL